MRIAAAIILILLWTAGPASAAAEPEVPWWKQQKLVFMWGQWGHSRLDKDESFWYATLPQKLFANVAAAGATVYVEQRWYNPRHAQYAHASGMKFFATMLQSDLVSPAFPGRFYVDRDGQEQKTKAGYKFKCPLDAAVYDKWLVEPHLEGVRAGLIDGIHVDWEYYGGNGEATGICYCHDCFATFLRRHEVQSEVPLADARFALLEKRDLVKSYEDTFHHRRVELFTHMREQLQAVKADLIFSSYDIKPVPKMPAILKAWNTPQVPLIWLDQRHYANDDRQPWWQSYSEQLRKEGCLYIPGGWTNALFGNQASQVSAARWIYEAAVNEDGCWLWFQRELDDEILRAYAVADRQLKTVQNKVGRFLLQGQRDRSFATAVEWTGRPELESAVMTCGYQLAGQYLAHVNNVHTEWPLRTRVRIPRLPAGEEWTIQDALAGLYYVHGQRRSAVWSAAQLHSGVVIAMEPRSDRFLLIAPSDASTQIAPSQLIRSREFNALGAHEDAAAVQATSADQATTDAPALPGELLYTASEPMGLDGGEGPLTLGNAVRTVNGDGSGEKRIVQLRGHLWSPRYSPDGRRIAFVHDTAGRGQICVSNVDGSDLTNISINDYCDRVPLWSPGGDRIAFVSDRDGDWNIHVMNADGSEQRRLTDHPGIDRAATWAPSGRRIAWESHVSGMPAVWVCDADGSNAHPLVRPDQPIKALRWDGRESGRFPANTVTGMSDNTILLRDPVWSPDGKHIAAVELDTGVVVAADGSSLRRVVSLQSLSIALGRRTAGVWRAFHASTAARTGRNYQASFLLVLTGCIGLPGSMRPSRRSARASAVLRHRICSPGTPMAAQHRDA